MRPPHCPQPWRAPLSWALPYRTAISSSPCCSCARPVHCAVGHPSVSCLSVCLWPWVSPHICYSGTVSRGQNGGYARWGLQSGSHRNLLPVWARQWGFLFKTGMQGIAYYNARCGIGDKRKRGPSNGKSNIGDARDAEPAGPVGIRLRSGVEHVRQARHGVPYACCSLVCWCQDNHRGSARCGE